MSKSTIYRKLYSPVIHPPEPILALVKSIKEQLAAEEAVSTVKIPWDISLSANSRQRKKELKKSKGKSIKR